MDTASVLGILLTVLAIALVAFAIYVLVIVLRLARELHAATAEVRTKLVPLIDKADVTLDLMNAELLRVDGIVSNIEQVSGAVSSASDVIRGPVNVVQKLGMGLARAFSRARRS
jgi:ABC-type transporter Mla subunit MlaD